MTAALAVFAVMVLAAAGWFFLAAAGDADDNARRLDRPADADAQAYTTDGTGLL